MRLLDDAESWLYSDEAENQEKSVYVEKLQSLKVKLNYFFYTKESYKIFSLVKNYLNKNLKI